MTILITGATGLIGTALTQHLLNQGHGVHFLTTRKEKIVQEKNHKGFYWNPTSGEVDVLAFDGVDCIINLVGATIAKRWTPAYKKIILESRTKTAALIYTSLKKIDHTVKHFVSASGISVYPNAIDTVYTETSTDVASNFLAEVVVAWEAAADQFTAIGIRVVKIRTGVVFDAKEGAFPKLVQPIKMGIPSAVGSGTQWISWIHRDDIVAIYAYAAIHELTGVYNAVAPVPVQNIVLTRLVAAAYKVPMWTPKVPAFLLKLLLGEMAVLVLEGQQVSVSKFKKKGFKFIYPTIESALVKLIGK
ncbi:MAG: hypothetical protein ACI9R6_000601 [Saprospiraceae bacterium]|jgi:uncharacterized protein (TIGR01777 family)